MPLSPIIARRIALPVICAPMFRVSTPALVIEACKAGIVGGLPRLNADGIEMFEAWLQNMRARLDHAAELEPDKLVGPIAVNFPAGLPTGDLRANLAICRKYGVAIVISVAGNPTEIAAEVHDWGGLIYHDVTSMKFAEKAIRAGVDGLICITSGGGGQSGTVSPLVLVPQISAIFSGTIILAGAVATGAAIRAAEILGADLAYIGTRFIATQEAEVADIYKQMLLTGTSEELLYTARVGGVPANWLVASLGRAGLDPDELPVPLGRGMRHDHLPANARPWDNLWSAGQGIDLIDDIPSVAELVALLTRQYREACQLASFMRS